MNTYRRYEKLRVTVERLLCNTEVVPLQPILQVLDEVKADLSKNMMGQHLEQSTEIRLEQMRHKLTLEEMENTLS